MVGNSMLGFFFYFCGFSSHFHCHISDWSLYRCVIWFLWLTKQLQGSELLSRQYLTLTLTLRCKYWRLALQHYQPMRSLLPNPPMGSFLPYPPIGSVLYPPMGSLLPETQFWDHLWYFSSRLSLHCTRWQSSLPTIAFPLKNPWDPQYYLQAQLWEISREL